eukprot:CAMPEP_0175088880 /NCGR_PEP_ID=MMETSP0086_2-20121207/486_1 /TAXON_ID=136419 /ORGANISM="Unknown Unknown, Strain D1" /LENGTH=443 /DNA_ID=CAMNT_0016361347 /DNA_START=71 /DNA_END=1399 /DNA_ORIENTATION=-
MPPNKRRKASSQGHVQTVNRLFEEACLLTNADLSILINLLGQLQIQRQHTSSSSSSSLPPASSSPSATSSSSTAVTSTSLLEECPLFFLIASFLSVPNVAFLQVSHTMVRTVRDWARFEGHLELIPGPVSVAVSSTTPNFVGGNDAEGGGGGGRGERTLIRRAAATMFCSGEKIFLFGGDGPPSDAGADGVSYNSDLFQVAQKHENETTTYSLHPVNCGGSDQLIPVYSGQLPNGKLFVFNSVGLDSTGHRITHQLDLTSTHQLDLTSISILDPKSLTWSNQHISGETPPARDGTSTVAVSNFLVLFGGSFRQGSSFRNDVWRLDCNVWKWTPIVCAGTTPTCRAFNCAVLVGRDVWIFGGYGYSKDKDFLSPTRAEVLHLGDFSACEWERVDLKAHHSLRLSSVLTAAQSYAIGSRVFVVAGASGRGGLDSTLLLDTASKTW